MRRNSVRGALAGTAPDPIIRDVRMSDYEKQIVLIVLAGSWIRMTCPSMRMA